MASMKLIRKNVKRMIVRNFFSVVLVFIGLMCLAFLCGLNLPEVSMEKNTKAPIKVSLHCKSSEAGLGEFGDMMVAMLPNDLAFTVFIPSTAAFEHELKLRVNDSLLEQNKNDTYAIVSRVLGFSAVPQHIPSKALPLRKEVLYDSVSGFKLYAWKDVDGTLVVNSIRSECTDIRRDEIIVHIMRGVVMDADFEQSFSTDYEN